MIIIYIIIPESPYWCATSGNHERGRAVIQRLNGGIEGYDVDFHYNLIRQAVDKEKSFQKQIDGDRGGFLQELANVKEVLVGINGVSGASVSHAHRKGRLTQSQFRTLIAFWPAFVQQMAGLAVVSGGNFFTCKEC